MEGNSKIHWLPESLTINDIVQYWADRDRSYGTILVRQIQDACKKGELPCDGDPIQRKYVTCHYSEFMRRQYTNTHLTPGTGLDVKIKRADFKQWLVKIEAWPLPDAVPLSVWFKNDTSDEAKQSKQQIEAKLSETEPALKGAAQCNHGDGVSQFSFYKSGDYWIIGKVGQERHLKSIKGYGYIAFLLQHPNQPISSIDIYHHFKTNVTGKHLYDANMSIDSGIYRDTAPDGKAITEIEGRLKNVNEALSGEYNFTPEKRRELLEEQTKLQAYLGRTPRTGRSETARKAILRAIETAKIRILAECPDLEPYLTIQTGTECKYLPPADLKFEWITDPSA